MTAPAAPRPIVVLVGRGHARAGSARLRGAQLAAFCAQAMEGSGHAVTLACHDELVADALVIVQKTVLLPPYREALPRLRAAGCRLVLDFLDTAVRAPLAKHGDGFLACSRPQAELLRAAWPGRPVVELPHHADVDVPASDGTWDRWRCAYFGDPRNAARLGGLERAGLVEPWATPVRNENGWREAMARYNTHYAVRRIGLPQERFKPFTKGMLAARVGAVAVVSRLDAEAMRLLGEDYPFAVTPGRGLPAVLRFVEEMREGFGDARWQLARAHGAAARDRLRRAPGRAAAPGAARRRSARAAAALKESTPWPTTSPCCAAPSRCPPTAARPDSIPSPRCWPTRKAAC